MTTIFSAIDAETLKNMALGLSAVSVIIAIVLMKLISSIVGKVVSTAIFVALALVGYSQRAEITSCVDKVKNAAGNAQVEGGALTLEATCTFFGQDVTVKTPPLSK